MLVLRLAELGIRNACPKHLYAYSNAESLSELGSRGLGTNEGQYSASPFAQAHHCSFQQFQMWATLQQVPLMPDTSQEKTDVTKSLNVKTHPLL